MKAQLFPLDTAAVDGVPESSGVVRLLDDRQQVIYIAGVPNLRQALAEQLRRHSGACFFQIEQTFMYTLRESELIRTHLHRYGQLPEGNALPDDMFD